MCTSSEHRGQLYTDICQRTRLARFAAADLDYLRKIPSLPYTSQTFGVYKRQTVDAMAPMTGETMTVVSGKGQISTTKADAGGCFLFENLPPTCGSWQPSSLACFTLEDHLELNRRVTTLPSATRDRAEPKSTRVGGSGVGATHGEGAEPPPQSTTLIFTPPRPGPGEPPPV